MSSITGGQVDIFEHEGRVTHIKKRKDASRGVLKHLKVGRRYSDEGSLIDSVASRRSSSAKS